MSKIIYKKPSNKIKYGYFIYEGGDRLILWGHGSTPAYSDFDSLESIIKPEFESAMSMFRGIDATILMPILPRNRNSKEYPAMKMDGQIMTQETMGLVEEVVPPLIFRRPDIEIANIVEQEFGKEAKFIVGGISAGANMANRFAILHPNNVKGIALLLAGDFIYPTMQLERTELKYPFGIDDINQLSNTEVDLSKYKGIPHFIFVGENDNSLENDPLPFELNNNKEAITLMRKLFGETQVERTKHYVNFLKANEYKVTSRIGKDVGHEINNQAVDDLRDWVLSL